MPILNYTTSIKSSRTVGEIQEILSKHGAMAVSVDYEGGEPVAVTFLILVGGDHINYRLPSNHDGVHKILGRQKVPVKFKHPEHARKVAWRIVKDWIEAQMALVEAEVARLEQVFLPYAVAKDGRTLFQHFEANPTNLLSA